MDIQEFNLLSIAEATTALKGCCHCQAWASHVIQDRPFTSKHALLQSANQHWATISENDFLEACGGHIKIGDISKLKDKFSLSHAEQGQVTTADEDVLQALIDMNDEYENKFGFIFIVCATGKSAEEMRDLLLARLPHSRQQEIKISSMEHQKITSLRLNKLFPDEEDSKEQKMSKITLSTHVLDQQRGQPVSEMQVSLISMDDSSDIAKGVTDAYGRISQWQPQVLLTPGIYQLQFETGAWFSAMDEKTLYPQVKILFQVESGHEHYHIPLLLSAYGYSTYRGS